MALEEHRAIHDKVEEIMGKPTFIVGAFAGRDKKPTPERIEKFKEYIESFYECDRRGILRTCLIVVKPYAKREDMKDTWAKLREVYEAAQPIP